MTLLPPHLETLASLRASLARPGLAKALARASLGHAGADLVLQGGLMRGGLHEVFAAPGHEVSATGFAVALALRLAAGRPLAWIAPGFAAQEYGAACPAGLAELGLDPARLLLLALPRLQDGLRAAGDALTCTSLGALILEVPGQNPKLLDLTASRRLALAAAEHEVPLLLLRPGAGLAPSAADTRWLVKAAASAAEEGWGQPVFDVSLVRHRQGALGQWVMAWSCDNGCFEPAKAAAGPVVSLSSDRQAEAA